MSHAPYETSRSLTLKLGPDEHELQVTNMKERPMKADPDTAQLVLLHDSSPSSIYIVEVGILVAIFDYRS